MIEISLTYACECVDTWEVSDLGSQEQTMRSTAPCVPESCQSCLSHGRPCPTREGMGPAYVPVEFVDVTPKRYTRMKSTPVSVIR